MTDDQTASRFTGAWRLLSCETRDSSGLVQFPFGERPGGQLLYDGAGNMSAQLGRTNRARFAAKEPALGTDAEVRDAFDGYLAYFGTYAVDESTRTVTHHVVGASFPNWVGVNLARDAYSTRADDSDWRRHRSRWEAARSSTFCCGNGCESIGIE